MAESTYEADLIRRLQTAVVEERDAGRLAMSHLMREALELIVRLREPAVLREMGQRPPRRA